MTINQSKHYKKINIQEFISDDHGSSFEIKSFFKLLWLYRWVLLLVTLVAMIIGTHMASKQKPIYTSALSILVQPQFANLAQVGQGFVEERTYRYYETQYQIIRSRAVLEKVAVQLNIIGDDSVYRYSNNENILMKWLQNFDLIKQYVPNTQFERAIKFSSIDGAVGYLRSNLGMKSSDETELLELNFSSPNSQFSADVANMTAIAYQDYIKQNKVSKVNQASSWLEKQLETIKGELSTAESELQNYRAKVSAFGTASLTSSSDRSLDSLKAAKARAQANYAAVAQRYGEQHPKRLAVKAELSAAQSALSRGTSVAVKERSKEFELVRLEEKVGSARNLYNMFLQRYQEANKSTDVQLNDSTIVDFAQPAKQPSNMTGVRTVLLYTVLGLLSAVSLIMLRFHFDNTYKSHHKLEKHLGIPVLGLLPKLSKKLTKSQAIGAFYRKPSCGLYTENVNRIRTSLDFVDTNNKPKVIQLTSSVESEGKSTLSYNLALSCAHMGMKTVIIDADMRRPQLHNIVVKKASRAGLSDWLKGNCALSEAIKVSVHNKALSVITAGNPTNSPLELIATDGMKKLVDALSEHYDCVIIDSPPILPVADSLELAKLASEVILVVESGRTEVKVLREAFDSLVEANVMPMGTVLSKISETSSEYYYPRSSYGYSYTSA